MKIVQYKLLRLKKERKKIEGQWTQAKGSEEYHQENQHRYFKSPVKTERNRENIWRNNVPKLLKFDEIHEYRQPKTQQTPNKMNSKTHTETYHTETLGRQRFFFS